MPRIFGSNATGNEAVVPTSYTIDYIRLTNHNKNTTDIQSLVTDFSITESIYTPSLLLSMNIKDPVNMMEEYELSGQETIAVKLRKKRFGDTKETELDLLFQVTEYPVYAKFPNYLQTYVIKGISTHAYTSRFKKISRAFSGDVKRLIRDILKSDLGYDAESIYISDKEALSASLIIPNLTPTDAIAWILRRSFDGTGSPWYCYETMQDGISVEPQSDMVSYTPHRTYKEGKMFKAMSPGTKEDYEEREARILSIASDLRMSKYIAGANGAYGSTSEYIDISKKSRTVKKFSYASEYGSMTWLNPNKNNLDPDYGFDGIALPRFDRAAINYVPINELAFKTNKNYHHGTIGGKLNRAQSYLDNLDNITHEITVAGDFGLSAGKVVNLVLNKSIDPAVEKKGRLSRTTSPFDEVLSGKHLVTSVIHQFGEEYTCLMKVKKDSMSVTYY